MYYRGTPIVWKSKRQSIRALSTCESEYVAIFDIIQLAKQQGWYDWFEDSRELPLTFSDSQSALALSKNSILIVTKRSKHMNIRFHQVKDHLKDLCFVSSGLNRADPLTKSLHSGKYLALFKNELDFDCKRVDDELDSVDPYIGSENEVETFGHTDMALAESKTIPIVNSDHAAIGRAYYLAWLFDEP